MTELAQAPNTGDDARTLARNAFITSVAGYLGMLVVVVAFNVAIAKRDVIGRHFRRARAVLAGERHAALERRALAEFARDVSEISHADLAGDEPV